MSLLKKLFSQNGDAVFAELNQIKASVEAWRREFAQLAARVATLETAESEARQAYFANPNAETFDALVSATAAARENRAVFNAHASISSSRVEQIVETPAVHELLKKAFRLTAAKLRDLADKAEADDQRRCAELGIQFEASPTARELRRKAERVADGLGHMGNPDESKPRWHWAGVLDSL